MVPKSIKGDPEGPFKGRGGGGTEGQTLPPRAPSNGRGRPINQIGQHRRAWQCTQQPGESHCGKTEVNTPHRADCPAGGEDQLLLTSSRKSNVPSWLGTGLGSHPEGVYPSSLSAAMRAPHRPAGDGGRVRMRTPKVRGPGLRILDGTVQGH